MDIFVAVAEPTRRAILDMLAEGDRPAGELVAAFPALTQPAVSRHLRVLLDVGLVAVRPEAQRRIYALRPERLAELDAWLGRYRRFWAAPRCAGAAPGRHGSQVLEGKGGMTMGSPLGRVVIDGDRAAIVFERRISHPIDVVWAAITEPDRRRSGSARPRSTRARGARST